MKNFNFPKVKNVAPNLLSDDIKGFDPGNPSDVEEWREIMENMFKNVEEDFKKAGKELLTINIIPATTDYSDLELKPVKPMKNRKD